MRIFLLGIFISSMFAFSSNAWAVPDFSSQKLAVFYGHDAPDSDYSAVVSLALEANDKLYPYCSGVLIRENVVLTAAHCLQNEENFDFQMLYNNRKIHVTVGQHIDSKFNTPFYDIQRFVIHPDYSNHHHDIAVVFLNHIVPPQEAQTIDIYSDNTRFKAFAQNHQTVEFIGFGTDENNHSGSRLVIEGTVSSYCPNAVNDCGYTVLDTEVIAFPKGSFVHEISSGGPCHGDSGGPVVIKNNTGSHLLGIVSYGDDECSRYSVSTSAADHIDWILSEIDGDDENVSHDDCSAVPMQNKNNSPLMPLIFMTFWIGLMKKFKLSVANNPH